VQEAILIVFGGLPGVGKTTLAKTIARKLEAVYLRVDTIEQALRFSEMLLAEVGPAGYLVAYRLAEENLRIGRTVVVDSVNPLNLTRDAWLSVAADASTNAIEIEVICSDPSEHRKRMETRKSDIDGYPRPRGNMFSSELTKTGKGLILYSTQRTGLWRRQLKSC
jgi:predicted kinase